VRCKCQALPCCKSTQGCVPGVADTQTLCSLCRGWLTACRMRGQGIERGEGGAVTELRGELHLEGDVKATKCARRATPSQVVLCLQRAGAGGGGGRSGVRMALGWSESWGVMGVSVLCPEQPGMLVPVHPPGVRRCNAQRRHAPQRHRPSAPVRGAPRGARAEGVRVCEGPRWKLTWLPAAGADLVPLTLVDFGYLVTKRRLEDEDAFQDYVNEHTARACAAG